MKLYILPNGGLLLVADRALSNELVIALRNSLETLESGKIAVFAEPLEVIDLREPKR